MRWLLHVALFIGAASGLAGCREAQVLYGPEPAAERIRVADAKPYGPLAASVSHSGDFLLAFVDPQTSEGQLLVVGRYESSRWQRELVVPGVFYMRPEFVQGAGGAVLYGRGLDADHGNELAFYSRQTDGTWVPGVVPPVVATAGVDWSLGIGEAGETHWAVVASDSRSTPLTYYSGGEDGWSHSLVSFLSNSSPALELVDGEPVIFYWEQQSGEFRMAMAAEIEGSWEVTVVPLPRIMFDPAGIEPWRLIPDLLTASLPAGGVAIATLDGGDVRTLLWDGSQFAALIPLKASRLPADPWAEPRLLDLGVDDHGRIHLLIGMSAKGHLWEEGDLPTTTVHLAIFQTPDGPWWVREVADDVAAGEAQLVLIDGAESAVVYIAVDGVLYLQPLDSVQES